MNQIGQTLALLAAIALGLALPLLHDLGWLVRPITMLLLGLAFLKIDLADLRPKPSQIYLLLIAPALGLAAFAILQFWDRELAITALVVALSPTATAAPVIAGLLGGRTAYVAQMVLASSLIQPIILALAFGLLGQSASTGAMFAMLGQLMATILIPLAIALVFRRLFGRASQWLGGASWLSFAIWLPALAIACAIASDFVLASQAPAWRIALIAGISLALCLINFGLGRWVGGKSYKIEAGQSLGQKNTVFSLWAALSFANPLVALGPASYILWHNLWNAWQLSRSKRDLTAKGSKPQN